MLSDGGGAGDPAGEARTLNGVPGLRIFDGSL